MTAALGLYGPLAIGVICALLFVKGTGVPLPMFPESGLLLVAGVLIGAGDISPWLFLPLAYLACVGGALGGYTWAHHVGRERLERVADRLRLRRHLDRAAQRLRRAGTMGIAVGRLLPGSRVYTSLVAGVVGMPLTTFIRGVAGSDVIWLGLLVGAGVAIGIPAADYLHLALGIFMRGTVVVAMLLASLAVLSLVRPVAVRTGTARYSRPLRLTIAIGPDVAIVAAVAVLVSVTLTEGGLLTGAIGTAIVVSAALLVYVASMRLAFGSTIGERLGRLSYSELIPLLT